MEYEEEDINDYKLPEFESRLFRLLARYFLWPFQLFMRYKVKAKLQPVNKVHDFFAKSKRINIIPLRSGERGFMITIDQNKALYFYQDGDGFRYDGCEMGHYEKGDVTLFDDIKS